MYDIVQYGGTILQTQSIEFFIEAAKKLMENIYNANYTVNSVSTRLTHQNTTSTLNTFISNLSTFFNCSKIMVIKELLASNGNLKQTIQRLNSGMIQSYFGQSLPYGKISYDSNTNNLIEPASRAISYDDMQDSIEAAWEDLVDEDKEEEEEGEMDDDEEEEEEWEDDRQGLDSHYIDKIIKPGLAEWLNQSLVGGHYTVFDYFDFEMDYKKKTAFDTLDEGEKYKLLFYMYTQIFKSANVSLLYALGYSDGEEPHKCIIYAIFAYSMKLPVPSDFFYVLGNRNNKTIQELLKRTPEFSVKTFPSLDEIKVNKAFLICVDSKNEKFSKFFASAVAVKCQDLNSSIVFPEDVIKNPLLEIIKIAFLQGAIQYNRADFITNIVAGANIERIDAATPTPRKTGRSRRFAPQAIRSAGLAARAKAGLAADRLVRLRTAAADRLVRLRTAAATLDDGSPASSLQRAPREKRKREGGRWHQPQHHAGGAIDGDFKTAIEVLIDEAVVGRDLDATKLKELACCVFSAALIGNENELCADWTHDDTLTTGDPAYTVFEWTADDPWNSSAPENHMLEQELVRINNARDCETILKSKMQYLSANSDEALIQGIRSVFNDINWNEMKMNALELSTETRDAGVGKNMYKERIKAYALKHGFKGDSGEKDATGINFTVDVFNRLWGCLPFNKGICYTPATNTQISNDIDPAKNKNLPYFQCNILLQWIYKGAAATTQTTPGSGSKYDEQGGKYYGSPTPAGAAGAPGGAAGAPGPGKKGDIVHDKLIQEADIVFKLCTGYLAYIKYTPTGKSAIDQLTVKGQGNVGVDWSLIRGPGDWLNHAFLAAIEQIQYISVVDYKDEDPSGTNNALLVCNYKNKTIESRPFTWLASQAQMCAVINEYMKKGGASNKNWGLYTKGRSEVDITGGNNRLFNAIYESVKQQRDAKTLNTRTDNEIFACQVVVMTARLLKFMGDKSHIIGALIYSYISEKPYYVCTFDRPLITTVMNIIYYGCMFENVAAYGEELKVFIRTIYKDEGDDIRESMRKKIIKAFNNQGIIAAPYEKASYMIPYLDGFAGHWLEGKAYGGWTLLMYGAPINTKTLRLEQKINAIINKCDKAKNFLDNVQNPPQTRVNINSLKRLIEVTFNNEKAKIEKDESPRLYQTFDEWFNNFDNWFVAILEADPEPDPDSDPDSATDPDSDSEPPTNQEAWNNVNMAIELLIENERKEQFINLHNSLFPDKAVLDVGDLASPTQARPGATAWAGTLAAPSKIQDLTNDILKKIVRRIDIISSIFVTNAQTVDLTQDPEYKQFVKLLEKKIRANEYFTALSGDEVAIKMLSDITINDAQMARYKRFKTDIERENARRTQRGRGGGASPSKIGHDSLQKLFTKGKTKFPIVDGTGKANIFSFSSDIPSKLAEYFNIIKQKFDTAVPEDKIWNPGDRIQWIKLAMALRDYCGLNDLDRNEESEVILKLFDPKNLITPAPGAGKLTINDFVKYAKSAERKVNEGTILDKIGKGYFMDLLEFSKLTREIACDSAGDAYFWMDNPTTVSASADATGAAVAMDVSAGAGAVATDVSAGADDAMGVIAGAGAVATDVSAGADDAMGVIAGAADDGHVDAMPVDVMPE